jgi:hypothetical protein
MLDFPRQARSAGQRPLGGPPKAHTMRRIAFAKPPHGSLSHAKVISLAITSPVAQRHEAKQIQ